ncbi:MAG: hypothetical protein JWM16_1929 [Verrucomicrobiales bacterium]|jgi:hypothetical protein|nr:hypothetical protein [Verrucomicrobiales bacterium]
MSKKWTFAATLVAATVFVGCQTAPPPGVEQGPHGTIGYDVFVDASPPGARIEVNGEDVGPSPVHIKVFGDKDGTFHDFGSYYYTIRALPIATNQFAQTKVYQTGHMMTPEDRIPQRIYFDMNQPTPVYPAGAYPPVGGPIYVEPPPVYYYGPGPYYYGPAFRFHYGPRPYYGHRRW